MGISRFGAGIKGDLRVWMFGTDREIMGPNDRKFRAPGLGVKCVYIPQVSPDSNSGPVPFSGS